MRFKIKMMVLMIVVTEKHLSSVNYVPWTAPSVWHIYVFNFHNYPIRGICLIHTNINKHITVFPKEPRIHQRQQTYPPYLRNTLVLRYLTVITNAIYPKVKALHFSFFQNNLFYPSQLIQMQLYQMHSHPSNLVPQHYV